MALRGVYKITDSLDDPVYCTATGVHKYFFKNISTGNQSKSLKDLF